MKTSAPLWLVTVCLLLAACGSSPTEPVARVLEGAAGVLRGVADGQRSLGSADSGAASEQRGLARVEPVISDSGARYALVIGNSTYQYSPLVNPGNDARAMAAVLRERGFQVDQRTDLNSTQLQQAVREFSNRLRAQRGVGVVFFAGHGVEGENYLIPVDNARIRDAIDVRQYALSVNYLLERVQAAGSPLNVVILDACRDNPYQGSTRSLSRGLRGGGAPSGTLIAYATAPGRTADDNAGGDNGLRASGRGDPHRAAGRGCVPAGTPRGVPGQQRAPGTLVQRVAGRHLLHRRLRADRLGGDRHPVPRTGA